MKRRGNNEGTITKRPDGRWMGQVSMPDGSRRTAYGKTRSEVQEKLKTLHDEAAQAARLVPGKSYRTVGEFLATWIVTVGPSVKPKTAEYYTAYVQRYTGDISHIPPHQLKPQHLQKLYAKLLEKGTFGRPLSTSTVHHLHAVLHRAFASAVRQGVFLQNPCELVDAPRLAKNEMHVFSAAQARHFLEAVKGDRFEALFVLAISTGMRQGELLALTWDNVDLERGIVYVKKNLQWLKGKGPLIGDPKTNHSRRKIFIGPYVRESLEAHRVRQVEMREALGWADSSNYLFPNIKGEPMHASPMVHMHFEPIIKRAGLPDIRFHDLRHTAATLLLEAGINPKVVSEMLGHSSVSITLSLYSHATPAMHYTASVVMDKVLRGEIVPLALPDGLEDA